MKKIFSMIGALLAGAMMFSCNEPVEEITFGTEISASVTELAQFAKYDAEPQTLEVTANGDWMAVAPAWLEISPRSGVAGTTTVSVRAKDNYEKVEKDGQIVSELGPQRSATITFVGEQDYEVAVDKDGDGEQDLDKDGKPVWEYLDALAEVAVSQEGDPNKWDPAVPRPVTAQYFNEVATDGDGFTYVLTGTITGTYNADYGNFYLEDATGQVLIYGIYKDGAKCYTALGLKDGDTITVQGARNSYNGNPQMKNATYVSHVAGNTPEPEATTVANIDAITENGLYNITAATVVAVEFKNMVVKGENRLMYVKSLSNAAANYAIGDVISLTKATVKESYGVTVIDGAAALTIEKTGTATVDHGTPVAVDAAWIEGFVTALTPEYVTFSGEGAASGSAYSLNVAVEGSDINMSITLPTAEEVTALVGKTVTVKGYSFDYNSSKKYISIMKVELTEAE